MGTLNRYADLRGTLGPRSTCHVNRPGSAKLISNGKKLRSVIAGNDKDRRLLRRPRG
jgi:hypothetical protein